MIIRLISSILVLIGLYGTSIGQTLRGTILSRSFVGQVTGDTVAYNIYLPQGYARDTTYYPVVYNLHGLSGDQFRHNNVVATHFETAQDSGLIGPVIIVFPNGYRNSWWADSFDSKKMAETNVVQELIPTVDSLYRTIPDRQFRAIYGFSMGGFGASKFVTKFPHLFKTCVIHDGAMHSWEELKVSQPNIAREIFNNDESHFDKHSTWTFIARRDSLLSIHTSFRMVVGSLRDVNQAFRDTLQARAIPVDYVQAPCGHDLPCILEAEGLKTAAFVGQSMATPTGVDDAITILPNGYVLQQNFPNPFNPTTNITFSIAKQTRVKLEIYDLIGRPIATPIDNTVYSRGDHTLEFDASNLMSGMYLYRMTAGDFVAIKKMMVLK